MTCGSPARSRLAGALATLLAASPLGAQGLDLGAGALVTTADPVFAGAGIHVGWRPGRYARVALGGALGSDGEVAGRVEAMAQLLAPVAADAPLGAYVGAGIGLRLGAGDPGGAGEVLLLVAGVETAPQRRGGAFLEAGVGGGARLAAGWRWRWWRGTRER